MNIEWTTAGGNNQHSWDTGLNRNTAKQRAIASVFGKMAVKIAHEKNKRQVLCVNNGIVYASIREAEEALGVDHSKISAVASGKRNHCHGYRFVYASGRP